jgi:hypothetical protein
MGLQDRESEQSLLNRWEDDKTHTQQSYISKSPLLNDGSVTSGTGYMTAAKGTFTVPAGWGNIGTFGTKAGTFTFTPQTGWAYVLHNLSFNAVNPAANAGTLGTLSITGLRIDGENLGTTGAVSNFTTLFGEDLTMAQSLQIGYIVNLSGTALGTEGTWAVNANVSGWKFETVD